METVKKSVVAEDLGEDGGEWGAQRIFRAVKLLCVVLSRRMHFLINVSELAERTTPRANPDASCEPGESDESGQVL